jgi:hypothetical protein
MIDAIFILTLRNKTTNESMTFAKSKSIPGLLHSGDRLIIGELYCDGSLGFPIRCVRLCVCCDDVEILLMPVGVNQARFELYLHTVLQHGFERAEVEVRPSCMIGVEFSEDGVADKPQGARKYDAPKG